MCTYCDNFRKVDKNGNPPPAGCEPFYPCPKCQKTKRDRKSSSGNNQEKTLPVSKITLLWSCTDCKIQTEQPLGEITESGIAICPECGEDMELYNDVFVGK